MPQPAIQIDAAPIDQRSARPHGRAFSAKPVIVTLGEGDVAWAASPARQLHDRLLESFAAPAVRAEMVLSRRQRLLILAGSVTFLWSLIGAALALVLR